MGLITSKSYHYWEAKERFSRASLVLNKVSQRDNLLRVIREAFIISDILLYIGSGVIILWGIAHLIPTKAIVRGFGEISEDNKRILAMESIAEGLTLCFLGVLVLLVTSLAGSQSETALIVYLACAVMLIIMAILTALTGARTALLPYKICPVVKTVVAILFFLGA